MFCRDKMDIDSLSPEVRARLPEGKIVVVYGFLLGFLPNTVIAVRQGDDWLLPGGAVEGPGTPEGTDDGQHFRALAWHVARQTGLELMGLSNAIAVSIFEGELGPSVAVLYVGSARGKRTQGSLVDPHSIPDFAAICPVDAEQIRQFIGVTLLDRLWRKVTWFLKPRK